MKEFTNASMDFCDTDRQAIHFCIFTYRKAKAHGPFYNCLVILWLCLQWHHKEPEIPLSYWWKPFLLQIIWTWAPSLSTGSFPAHFYHLFFNSHSFPPCSSSAHLHPLSSSHHSQSCCKIHFLHSAQKIAVALLGLWKTDPDLP